MTTEDNVVVEDPKEVVTPQTPETPETPETPQTPETPEVPAPWYTKYGAENEDDFNSRWEELNGHKSKAEEVEQLRTQVEKDKQIAAQAAKYFDGTEEAAKIFEFVKKGVPSKVASEIMETTREEMQNDPMAALILAEAIRNPEKFKTMKKAGIEEAIREKYNLPEGEFTPTALMKSDAFDAITLIEKTRGDIGEVKNPFTLAAEEIKQRETSAQQAFDTRLSEATNQLEKLVPEIKEVTYKYGEKNVSLKVTPEEIKAIKESSNVLGYLLPDPSTKEGKSAIRGWFEREVVLRKLQSGELGMEIEKSILATAKQEAKKELHNGQAKVIDRAQGSSEKGKMSPIMEQAMKDGIQIPKDFPTNN